MKHKIRLFIIVLFIWQLIAMIVNKDVIIPYPLDVFLRMITMLQDLSFYQTIFITLSHVCIVVLMSAIVAFFLAYTGYHYPIVDEYVSPLLSVLQAIPNISFIILVLVWTESLQTVYIVLTLVIFPLLYHNLIQGFRGIDQDLEDVIILYHPPFRYKFLNVYFPLVKRSFLSGLKSSLSLGVKVAVMAEILAQLPQGVGRAINYCRIQFDMTGVFAWTVWLLILILWIELLLERFISERR